MTAVDVFELSGYPKANPRDRRGYNVVPITDHPAKFSASVLRAFQTLVNQERQRLDAYPLVLDPFAGVGRIHDLRDAVTLGVELEPEWAACRSGTFVGDATALKLNDELIDAVMTSPCYGNRLADSHNARDASLRKGYKFSLGRNPSEGSAAVLHWHDGPRGDRYRELHVAAIAEMVRVVKTGGLIVVNMSNHIRDRKPQRVVEWWVGALLAHPNLLLERVEPIGTTRMRFGRNHEARVASEHVIAVRKVATS